MTGFSHIVEVRVPVRFVSEAMLHLREVGRRGLEGFALWVGTQTGEFFDVTHTIIPKQQGIRTRKGVCVTIPPEELHRLNVWLYENERQLIAQIHSHPTNAYHSELDDELPIATTVGSLSLVVPNFARAPFALDTTAVYRLTADARWAEVRTAGAERLIKLTE